MFRNDSTAKIASSYAKATKDREAAENLIYYSPQRRKGRKGIEGSEFGVRPRLLDDGCWLLSLC